MFLSAEAIANIDDKVEKFDNKVETLYAIWCHINKVTDKNIVVWLSIYLYFIWVKMFYIDHVIQKVVGKIFEH